MKKLIFCVIFLLFFPLRSLSADKDFMPYWNFYTGQDFLDIGSKYPNVSDLEGYYIAGLSDALNLMASDDSNYHWLIICTKQKKTRQLVEIFKKWLNRNPERWHEPASSLFMEAIREACK